MRRLLVFLVILLASVWLGVWMVRHPGHVIILAEPWMIDMPLWLVLAAFALFLIAFYLVIDSIDWLQFVWFRLKNWWRFRREHRLYNKTQHGLAMLVEGRFKKAERLLLGGIHESVDPLMNYLGAARAAQGLDAYDRRDLYLKKAYQVAPQAALAIGLTKAELEMAHHQFECAAATLTHLLQLKPSHPQVLRLLQKVYVRLADWPHLLLLLPRLRKAKVLNKAEAIRFERHVYVEILRGASQKNAQELKQLWMSIPRSVRQDPDVVCAYVKQLSRFAETTEMGTLIRKTLKKHWQPELVKIYGTLPFEDLQQQLVVTGAWLRLYGQQPELLLTLGRLCTREKLWGKARDYFKKCLEIAPNQEASLAYGRLLEQLNEMGSAVAQYRDGLLQSV